MIYLTVVRILLKEPTLIPIIGILTNTERGRG
jgi:hypothetical protein